MKVSITSTIETSAEHTWALLKQSHTLMYVTRGLMGFKSIGSDLPIEWQQGKTERLRIVLFGLIPAWRHDITFEVISDSKKVMQTREAGGVIKTWDHSMSIETRDTHSCNYTDNVEIEAGMFTPLIWLYAQFYYRYRQFRWRYLVKKSAKSM